jgi:hypothetical protein
MPALKPAMSSTLNANGGRRATCRTTSTTVLPPARRCPCNRRRRSGRGMRTRLGIEPVSSTRLPFGIGHRTAARTT